MEFRLTENRTRLWLAVLALGILLALAGGVVIAFGSPAIAFAIVVGAVAGGIVLSNIEYGLYAVIGIAVLLPFGAVPLNVGFNPTFLDLALLAVFGMWLARGLTRQSERFVATPLALPIVVFLVLAIFSFVAGLAYAPVHQEVVRHFAEVLISIALFFVIVNVVQTREQLGRVVTALIVAGFLSAALGTILYFLPRNTSIYLLSLLRVFRYPTGDRVLRFIEDDPNNPMRAISTSVDPNVLGGLMILVTALTAPQLFASQPLLPRRWLTVMWATMVACMILTFSRGAFLGLGLALAVIATARYRPMIALMLVGVAVILFLPFTQDYVGHLQDAFMGSDRATQMRLGEYKDAINLISRYPIFGVGFGGSPDIDTYLGVSSVYLLMAEEMGLVGLTAFLVTMALFFYRVTQSWFEGLARDAFLASILLGVAGALLGALIGGLTDHYFFNLKFPHSVALFWLYVGLGMAAVRLGTLTNTDEHG
jgi:O-antigen ligase